MPSSQTLMWFKRMYRYGVVAKSLNFQIFTNRILAQKKRKVAIVIPNSVIPLASKRNLVKRRIRYLFHLQEKKAGNFDYLVSVKQDVSRCAMSELSEEILHLI